MYVWQKHQVMDFNQFNMSPRSSGAESYDLLAEEVIENGGEN